MTIEQTNKLVVAKGDRDLLKSLMSSKKNLTKEDLRSISKLAQDIDNAETFEDDEFPWDGIRLNSKVVIRDKMARVNYTYTVVLPEKADHRKCRLSVFSSMGSALFGRRRGDDVFWDTVNKKRYFIVMAVSQAVH